MVEVHKLAIVFKELLGTSLEESPALLDANAHDCDFLDAIQRRLRTHHLAAVLGKVFLGSAVRILFQIGTLVRARDLGIQIGIRHLL